MPSTLILTLLIMLGVALFLAKVLKLPRNVWLLFLIQPLAMSASPVIVFIGGILSEHLATNPSYATLPLSLMILGITTGTIPASLLAKKFGRKRAFMLGLSLSLMGTLLAMQAALIASFNVFMLACFIIGTSLAFVMQFRFAAIDSVSNQEDIGKVVSALMFAGIFAAFIGPELAVLGKDWLASPYGYAGSFLALAGLVVIAMILLQAFTNPEVIISARQGTTRPISQLIRQPFFIIAILSAAIGYGLMSLLMTATPISMHTMLGHSLTDTKWVIQSHIAAMYLPSLVTGWLLKRIGLKNILLLGVIMFIGVMVIALQGQHVLHYWWALVLLGIGWNLLFLTGTVLLAECYNASEKHKLQAVNDFMIFGVQAISSLLAGWLIFTRGWQVLVYYTAPFILLVLLASLWFYRLKYPSITTKNQ